MLNRCEFIGHVGRDPEIRTTQSGDKVASISIACTERWKDRTTGERREKTVWVPLSVWGGVVDVVERYVTKGSLIYVSGQFETRKWQDQSGQDRYSTEIVLRPYKGTLVLLGDPGRSGGGDSRNDDRGGYDSGSSYGDHRQGQLGGHDDPADDIPF